MDEEKKQVQADLTKTSDTVRTELDSRYKEFMSTAQVNMKDYVDKSKEDQELTERIALQLKKIDKLQENVSSWRTNISRNAREWEERNSAIKAEREATLKHLKTLKNKMQLWRQRQAKELAQLVKDAKDTEDTLESTTKKAERILRLVELCKPLETEREYVLSTDSQVAPAEIEKDVRQRIAATEPGSLETSEEDGKKAVSADWQYMERFWTKYNKVMLDNAAIAQERHHLEQENQQLQVLLKQYLDDVSINDNVMQSSNNNLLKTTKAPKNVVQMANTADRYGNSNTIVEGNKVVNDAARQRIRM
ncbi:flagellar associated protein [Angomonas deanei]|uniref:Sperm tail C-terminal domain containing protein, putative n=1 Tax=Angomonas deanei TaxID=59799 RepID=A0A7G2CI32_9TRYP|nr:flagellar associated protein [Angomonas deanei]CAD2219069.1 Sperm tail C-terminal domain containing protein, putative [Angomonas deanei]|eukprot:EPY30083.1 flagellar associated protein [Angomonas deanei]